ncbi:MAG TPA: glycoside hydrolase family 3 N-terminal domain-containing protein [Gemmatimonadaceae bacterium]|jgi:beta-N-acetylhexosaminidase|nr:glycoside hydrolase family 3 N-terminal domain-containing protein [Gemmatimonadaceae bacterium]
MTRNPKLFLAMALLLAGAGCKTTRSNSAETGQLGAATSSRWTDSVLASLTLREKAAQIVWPWVLGDYVSGDSPQWRRLTQYIQQDKVGGFIISVGSPTEVAAKLNAFQSMSKLPLLFGADLEAGAGFRARGGYFVPNAIDLGGAIVFPPEMAIGATGDTTLAYEQGRLTAQEGRALGIHIAYAPVLDVNNNPDNPVINTRSYGEDPDLVARMGVAFIHGLQDHGMIATGKHFPGHGDTGVNSHLALPVVTATRSRLDTVELVPFRAAVKGGVGAIMSFHGVMPALDSSNVPGTLSPKVLTELLRGEMGFKGIIISDAMDMRGVLDQFGAAEAAKRGIAAGIDVLIQPSDVAQTIDAVVAGVNEGRYTVARLDSSVRRVLETKRRLGLAQRKLVDLNALRFLVGDSSNVQVARRVAEKSITLVKDSLRLIPLSVPGARVLSITLARRTDLPAGNAFNAELRSGLPNLRTEFVATEDAALNYPRLIAAADSADVTIVSSYMAAGSDVVTLNAPQPFTNFVQTLAQRGRKPIVVSFGNPYLLQQLPWVGTYLIAWGGFPVSQTAAARALLGTSAISGHLPITIPPYAARGAGQERAAQSR